MFELRKIMTFEDDFGNVIGGGSFKISKKQPLDPPTLNEADLQALVARLEPVIERAVRKVIYPRY